MKISHAGAVGSFANLDRCLADGELDCQNGREIDIGATGKMSTIGNAFQSLFKNEQRAKCQTSQFLSCLAQVVA